MAVRLFMAVDTFSRRECRARSLQSEIKLKKKDEECSLKTGARVNQLQEAEVPTDMSARCTNDGGDAAVSSDPCGRFSVGAKTPPAAAKVRLDRPSVPDPPAFSSSGYLAMSAVTGVVGVGATDVVGTAALPKTSAKRKNEGAEVAALRPSNPIVGRSIPVEERVKWVRLHPTRYWPGIVYESYSELLRDIDPSKFMGIVAIFGSQLSYFSEMRLEKSGKKSFSDFLSAVGNVLY